MTRRDIVTCFHEPFGDAFYYGPEKISTMSKNWPRDKIEKSGRAHHTYDYVLQTILDAIKVDKRLSLLSIPLTHPLPPNRQEPNKRVLIKDMARHIIPPSHSSHTTAPSLQQHRNPKDPPNPTLLPTHLLHNFQFVFLIRNPSASVPSLYRCFLPPLSRMTELDTFDPHQLGYCELRILFDYLYPPTSHTPKSSTSATNPILIDADDLLSHPHYVLRSVCTRLEFPYSPSMLSWSSPEDQAHAEALFRKFAGYHEDALQSTGLHARAVEKAGSREEVDEEWRSKYGSEPAGMMREAVDKCMGDYEYLRGFRILPEEHGG